MLPLRALTAALFLLCLSFGSVAAGTHSLADRVQEGPAADLIRTSLRCLEKGEEAENEHAKLEWYEQGKELAGQAIERAPNEANAHFALFANWGRILQTTGWLHNAHHLPALWRELDRTLELDPNHSAALGAKGGLYLKLPAFLGGSVAKAEPLLRRAVDVDANAVGARLELAECYRQTDRRDPARELTLEALRLAKEQDKPRFVGRARELLEEIGGEGDRTARGPDPGG